MSISAAVLIDAKQAETSDTVQYTVTATAARIDMFTATNTSAAAETITINLISNAGSAGDDNKIISSRSLAAGETYICSGVIGHVLPQGWKISTKASAANSITIRASGIEING